MHNLKVNNKLWIISDTHFGHKNIIQYQQRPESHDVIMLSEWIWKIKEDDQVLHLGDLFLGKQGNPKRWAAVCSRLPGQKFLIKGNHDKQKDWVYEQAGFTIVNPFVATRNDGTGFLFSHRPVSLEYPHTEFIDRNWSVNIHGHVHGNEYRPDHDGTPLQGKLYINVSVEVTDLKPRQLGMIWN